MRKTDNLYFALLRSALWGDAGCDVSQEECNRVLEMASRQTTFGLVCHAALSTEAGHDLPEQNKAYLRQQLLSLAMTHHCFNALVARIVTALREKGIESVLMKGQGLAANYPIAELRECGDIDLFVGKENFDAACDVINAMEGAIEIKECQDSELHYNIVVDGIEVEIHHTTSWSYYPELESIYESYSDKGMAIGGNSMLLNGVNVWLPTDTFNALFVFHHAWNHFITSGVGMRQLCDWTMLLHEKRENINRNGLSEMLQRLRLIDAWQVFGCIAVDWLGLPKEEMPFYNKKCSKRAKRAVAMILKEGNFGSEWSLSKRRSSQTGMKRKLTIFLSIQIRQWRLFGVFPRIALRRYRDEMVSRTKKNMGRLATKIRHLWTK